jgi:hypothetical protein
LREQRGKTTIYGMRHAAAIWVQSLAWSRSNGITVRPRDSRLVRPELSAARAFKRLDLEGILLQPGWRIGLEFEIMDART